MPRRRKHRRNLFWDGFVVGVLGGTLFSLIVLGRIYASLQFRAFAKFAILVAFGLGSTITIYNAAKRKCLFGCKNDGLIVGMSLSAQMVDWILHGIEYP